jgi:putative integral membrane protein (TIGR02587 family)
MEQRETPTDSARDYLRGIGGGLLVGLPLLFTLEVWTHAFLLPPWKVALLLGAGFVVVVGYNALTGFRAGGTRTDVLVDSVETLGLSMVVAFAALLLLGRIDLGTGSRDVVGKVALESIPIAFGMALANVELPRMEAGGSGERGDAADDGPDGVGPFGRLFVSSGGALLFALNIAPTEEPVLIGIEAPWWLLLATMLATYLVTLALVFVAALGGSASSKRADGPLSHPLAETAAAYAISLLVSLILLWSFGRTDGASPRAILGQTVVLAIVASFGAAVGRLLVGPRPAPERTA